jgi:hypothetical protein
MNATDLYLTGSAEKPRLHRHTCKRVVTGLAKTVADVLKAGDGDLYNVSKATPASCCKPRAEIVQEANDMATAMIEAQLEPTEDPSDDSEENVVELFEPEPITVTLQPGEAVVSAGDSDAPIETTVWVRYLASKGPRYHWRSMKKAGVALATELGATEVHVNSAQFAIGVTAPTPHLAKQIADQLADAWFATALKLKDFRKTDAYVALPEKGSKWSTSERYRAEEEFISEAIAHIALL